MKGIACWVTFLIVACLIKWAIGNKWSHGDLSNATRAIKHGSKYDKFVKRNKK